MAQTRKNWKRGLLLEKWVALGKINHTRKNGARLTKISHSRKNGSHLEKLVTRGKLGDTEKSITFGKLDHTWKNLSNSVGHTWKSG